MGEEWDPKLLLSWHRQELHIYMKFLHWFKEDGVSINNIVFTALTAPP